MIEGVIQGNNDLPQQRFAAHAYNSWPSNLQSFQQYGSNML